jgi:hypothetical protein
MPENAGRTMLGDIEKQKWNARYVELAAHHELAGLFHGWIPDGYFAPGRPRILYVGKATSGPFNGFQSERISFNRDSRT